MAGFLGLFNYEKEGPGIDKNAPKKKTFFVFFETFFRNFWKFMVINIVYSLISLPILTNGLSNAGLTNITRNIARNKHSFGLSDFFETIKKNYKQALWVGIINTIVYGVIAFDLWFFYNSEGTASTIGLGLAVALLFIFTVMNFYIWTLMITFDFSIKALYKNSFKFVFINMKGNLICFFSIAVIYAVNVLIFISSPVWMLTLTIELAIYILTFPAFEHLLVQFCVFPSIKKCVIDPYYKEHPFEDIERRRDLGLEIEEERKEEAEEEEGNTENI